MAAVEKVTLVDTNVVVDVLTMDPIWYAWSADALVQRGLAGPLFINEVVYAELAVRAESEAKLNGALADLDVEIARTPISALFMAGKAFQQYRGRGGTRSGVLPDFFIGAHAFVAGFTLLTRDPQRFKTYFPDVDLITPDADLAG